VQGELQPDYPYHTFAALQHRKQISDNLNTKPFQLPHRDNLASSNLIDVSHCFIYTGLSGVSSHKTHAQSFTT
jgi:hypothetical protein